MTRVRPMTEADWTEVLALDRARYGAESWSKYFVRMAPRLFGDASFVAEREGRLIGYVLAAPEGEARIWILALLVARGAERQGVGEALARRALEAAAAAGRSEARLTVEPANVGARRLYERLGFAFVEEDPAFYGEGEARLVLAAHLSRVTTT